MGFNDELQALVDEVANRVDRWTGHTAWTFEPGSPASAEVANTEVRADGTPWGDRPVRTAYQCAQMATKLAVELSRCTALLIGARRPAPGIEAETRASLEAGSAAWWLLEPARFQNSAIGPDLGFYAARSYSLMRPPRTGRRWIRFLGEIREGVIGSGRAELAAAMGPPPVVMALVLGQDRPQMPFAEDQHPVGDLRPGGEHEPFRISVGPHRRQHTVRMIGIDVCG